jgi:hypothetical protein
MQARCIAALYDADLVGGMRGSDLISVISATGAEKRAWSVLLDLVEAERLERVGVGDEARYSLAAEEADDEFMRRYAAHRPPTQHDERSA